MNEPTVSPNTSFSSSVIYEHPLSEQIRTYLRLENLFETHLELQQRNSQTANISALHNLLEILDCLDRGDIKGDLLKQLEQQKLHFQQLADSPYIDELKLKTFLQQLEQLFKWIHQYPGKFGSKLRKDRFIELINNRIRIPGGSCSFDLPELHHFLNQAPELKQKRFQYWFSHLSGLHQCLKILLRLFRENAEFESHTAMAGQFQHQLGKQQSANLLRIRLDRKVHYFPEVSGSKHCFNVRFLMPQDDDIVALNQDLPFELSIC